MFEFPTQLLSSHNIIADQVGKFGICGCSLELRMHIPYSCNCFTKLFAC